MSDDISDKDWLEEFESEINRSDDFLYAGNPEEALRLLNELNKKGYEGYFLEISFAKTYIMLNKWNEASAHIEKAFSTKPEWHWAIVLKAILAKLNKDKDQQEKLMKLLLNENVEGAINFLSVLSDISEINQCWNEFKASTYLMITYFVPSSENLPFVLLKTVNAGYFKQAIPLAERIIKESPNVWHSYIGSAYLYAKMGEKKKGRQFLNKAESLPGFQCDEFIEEIKTLLK